VRACTGVSGRSLRVREFLLRGGAAILANSQNGDISTLSRIIFRRNHIKIALLELFLVGSAGTDTGVWL
jgi:hypothetical protein